MAELYSPIEPYDQGMLDVGDRNLAYWETCGYPEGKPALVVHGEPGTGCSTRMRRAVDPGRYRVVLFDQRGCARSNPHATAGCCQESFGGCGARRQPRPSSRSTAWRILLPVLGGIAPNR